MNLSIADPAASRNVLDVTEGRDDRVLAFFVVAVAATLAGLVTGRIGLVVFAAPFLLALVAGYRRRSRPITVTASMPVTRIVEGDEFETVLTVAGFTGTIEILLDLGTAGDLVPVDERPELAWEAAVPGQVSIRLRAVRWGRYRLLPMKVRLRDPERLLFWEGPVAASPEVLVLPASPRLDRLLEPRSSHTMAGFHLARRGLGSGTDFAELREYQPGDRLRDLNRAASGRLHTPIVNRYHPELSGDVVIVLDTYIDASYNMSESARQALVEAGQAIWAIASAHLSAQDRVGLATFGRLRLWLPPAAGARARYAILEQLLTAGERFRTATGKRLDPDHIPPAALVVFVSPLWTDGHHAQLAALQARGRELAVIQLDSSSFIPPPATGPDVVSRRLFDMAIEDRVDGLRTLGITVVRGSQGDLGAAVSAAAKVRRRVRTAGAR